MAYEYEREEAQCAAWAVPWVDPKERARDEWTWQDELERRRDV